ncbi:MAG TPA: HEAT repeat domain-containing protein [Bryobacteraceae bacterium]|nr:HEAT repeat domain-containing protein [Bryobacteraceae bacterium]
MKGLVILTVACSVLLAADPEALVRQVAGYDFGPDVAAVRELEALAYHSAGTPDVSRIERLLIAGLDSSRSLAAKDAFCRDLAILGGDAAVPKLAELLLEPATAEMARYTLERIPGERSATVLRDALPRTSSGVQTGIVVSLGRRRDAASVTALKPLLASKDARLAEATAAALGSIDTPEARGALMSATPSTTVSSALLEIAEKSDPVTASQIFQRLAGAEQPEAVRIAVLTALARVDARRAAPFLRAALHSESPRVQAIAVRTLAQIDATALMSDFLRLADRARMVGVEALASFGAPGFLRLLLDATRDASEAVRVAALNGLAKAGTPAEIPLLAARAAATSGDEQAAARGALIAIRDSAADAAILGAIPSAAGKMKMELIRAAGQRGTASSADVLLGCAAENDRAVQIESIRALRETATAAQVPAMLALMKSSAGSDRTEWERTLAATIRRSPGAPVNELVSAYGSGDAGMRGSLLSVLSAVGNSAALPLIRSAAADGDPELQRRAVNALAGWPTPEPMSDLLVLARTAPNPTHRILALRGYIQLAQLPSSRTPSETAALLKTAIEAATRPEEKKLILSAVQRVACPESLEIARQETGDPQVAAEAKAAETTLEHELAYVAK